MRGAYAAKGSRIMCLIQYLYAEVGLRFGKKRWLYCSQCPFSEKCTEKDAAEDPEKSRKKGRDSKGVGK